MDWSEGDWKLFATGLAIGGKWNRTHGTLPGVVASFPPGTYWHTVELTLSCPVEGADIFYSTNGGVPLTHYQGEEIYVGNTMDVMAFAVKGQDISGMSRFRYIIDNPLDTEDLLPLPPPEIAEETICGMGFGIDIQDQVVQADCLPTIREEVAAVPTT